MRGGVYLEVKEKERGTVTLSSQRKDKRGESRDRRRRDPSTTRPDAPQDGARKKSGRSGPFGFAQGRRDDRFRTAAGKTRQEDGKRSQDEVIVQTRGAGCCAPTTAGRIRERTAADGGPYTSKRKPRTSPRLASRWMAENQEKPRSTVRSVSSSMTSFTHF